MLTILEKHRVRPVTTAELADIPLPPRGDRPNWQGVKHIDLYHTLRELFQGYNYYPKRVQLAVTPDSNRFIGGITFIRECTGLGTPAHFSIAWDHDNLSRRALALSAGVTVQVCGNGCIWGDVTSTRKHTKSLNLREYLRGFVRDSLDSLGDGTAQLRRLTERPVRFREEDALFMRLGREKILPWNLIGRASELWYNPPHEEFRDRHAFNLYQAVNEAAKELAPARQRVALRDSLRVTCEQLN